MDDRKRAEKIVAMSNEMLKTTEYKGRTSINDPVNHGNVEDCIQALTLTIAGIALNAGMPLSNVINSLYRALNTIARQHNIPDEAMNAYFSTLYIDMVQTENVDKSKFN